MNYLKKQILNLSFVRDEIKRRNNVVSVIFSKAIKEAEQVYAEKIKLLESQPPRERIVEKIIEVERIVKVPVESIIYQEKIVYVNAPTAETEEEKILRKRLGIQSTTIQDLMFEVSELKRKIKIK